MTYLVLHREDDGQQLEDDTWNAERVEHTSVHGAITSVLTAEKILDREFIVYSVDDSWHSDEFINDGSLDEYLEEELEDY